MGNEQSVAANDAWQLAIAKGKCKCLTRQEIRINFNLILIQCNNNIFKIIHN